MPLIRLTGNRKPSKLATGNQPQLRILHTQLIPTMIVKLAETDLKTKFGEYHEVLYYDGQKESHTLIMGNIRGEEDVLCRIHSSCIFAHHFNSIECDCREQMEISQQLIQRAGKGIIIWLDQEGKGNGQNSDDIERIEKLLNKNE